MLIIKAIFYVLLSLGIIIGGVHVWLKLMALEAQVDRTLTEFYFMRGTLLETIKELHNDKD